jgi:hypothetical protein
MLFIASCFGGLLLLRALILSSLDENSKLCQTLAGIIFLATPFQGTSFKRVARWARPFLESWGVVNQREWAPLLKLVEDAAPDIDNLVRDFTSLWKHRMSKCQIFTFYERQNSNLLRMVKLGVIGTDEPVSHTNTHCRALF